MPAATAETTWVERSGRRAAASPGTPGIVYTSSTEIHAVPVKGDGTLSHASHDALGNLITGASAAGVLISLSPLLIRKIAETIGNKKVLEDMNYLSGGCCPIIAGKGYSFAKTNDGEPVYGIGGALSAKLGPIPGAVERALGVDNAIAEVLKKVPQPLGDALSRDEVKLALLGGGITLIGHAGGNLLDRVSKRAGNVLRRASQVVGVVFALPALLPGIGHAALVASTVLGLENIDREAQRASGPGSTIAGILGKPPGPCLLEHGKRDSAFIGGGALALCCGLPAVLGALPGIVAAATGQKNQGKGR